MSFYHDEIEIEDFEYCEEEDLYTYPCPCGDEFIITRVNIFKINLFPNFHKNLFKGGTYGWIRGSNMSKLLIES